MSRKLHLIFSAALAGSTLLTFIQAAEAQTFVYQTADLLLTLRKTGTHQENNEVVVDLGQASNYVNAAIGTRITNTQFSASQLVPGCFASLNYLTWAVTGDYQGTSYPGYPAYTLWVTVPRANNAVRSADVSRLDRLTQNTVRSKIDSIFNNAAYISQQLVTSNQFNTPSLVREPIATYPNNILSVWMKGLVDATQGTLNDSWPNTEPNSGNLEITTAASFSGSVRSDLYEVRPLTDSHGNPIVDPHTGTNGLAYYVGYFEFKSDGTLAFTREAASLPAPPPPQIVSVTRSGSTSTVYFTTTNGATYTLYYTNSAGLSAPVSNWASSAATLTGNGNTNSLADTTTDPIRFYRVGVH
ncbi:MAG TPA: hypothetical protein VN578_13230 [Candidatus Binatia bacterium]|jgi:hypothetical protein|nr:hypothetical protein [Candidatus Binatia bacterium]